MELAVFERLILLNILPKEGDFTTLKIMRKLKEDLSFSEEEHKNLGIKIEDGMVRWKSEADSLKEVNIGEKAHDIISEILKELNNKKKLTEEHMSLYEKFIENNK